MDRKIIEETKQHWQKYYKDELTELDCEQIVRNVIEFFDILDEWDKKLNTKDVYPKLDNFNNFKTAGKTE